jgi:hypothetical protein
LIKRPLNHEKFEDVAFFFAGNSHTEIRHVKTVIQELIVIYGNLQWRANAGRAATVHHNTHKNTLSVIK